MNKHFQEKMIVEWIHDFSFCKFAGMAGMQLKRNTVEYEITRSLITIWMIRQSFMYLFSLRTPWSMPYHSQQACPYH